MDCLVQRKALLPDNDVNAVFDHIWRGGYDDVQNSTAEQAQVYYQSCMDNYLIADAVNDEGIWNPCGMALPAAIYMKTMWLWSRSRMMHGSVGGRLTNQ